MENIKDNEKELREILVYAEMYKKQRDALLERIMMNEAKISEIKTAQMVLSDMKNRNNKEEALIPIGGDVYLPVNLSTDKNVLLSIGAGVIVEKGADAAIESMNTSMGRLEEGMKNIRSNLAKIEAELVKLDQKAKKIVDSNE